MNATGYGQRMRRVTGQDKLAMLRRTRWLVARQIREQLPVFADRQTVGRQLGVSAQRVEQIELEALYKLCTRLREVCRG